MLGLVLTAVCATASPVEGGESTGPQASVHRLRPPAAVDLALTAALGAVWVGSEALWKDRLAPSECRWCDRLGDTDLLNAVDSWGRGLRVSEAQQLSVDMASNAVAFGLLPLAVAGCELFVARADGAAPYAAEDLLAIAEAVVIASAVNQAVKFSVGRERPFVHAMNPAQRGETRDPADNNLSFYSGHSSFAFSAVVASGTVAALRGYRWGWLLWAAGLPIAVSVPMLRMAADRHYLTDVLVGSAIGAAIGLGVPLLLHPRTQTPALTVCATPGGVGFSGAF